jgi:hypothetical protein
METARLSTLAQAAQAQVQDNALAGQAVAEADAGPPVTEEPV